MLSFDWSMDAVPLIESIYDPRNFISILFYGHLLFLGLYSLRRISLDNKCLREIQETNGNVSCTNGKSPNGNYLRHRIPTKQNGHPYSSNGKTPHGDNVQRTKRGTKVSTFVASERRLLVSFLVSLGVLVFAFIPACNLFFYVGFVVAERVLYIPSLGFCLLIACGADVLWQKCGRAGRQALAMLLAVVLLLFSARTVNRNEDWRNEETLYRSGIAVNPAKAWGNLGNVLGQQNRTAEAEEAYKKALTYRSNMADTHYNLGILLAGQKRYSEAITCYERAIRFRPRLAVAHLNLGIVLDQVGEKQEAVKVRPQIPDFTTRSHS